MPVGKLVRHQWVKAGLPLLCLMGTSARAQTSPPWSFGIKLSGGLTGGQVPQDFHRRSQLGLCLYGDYLLQPHHALFAEVGMLYVPGTNQPRDFASSGGVFPGGTLNLAASVDDRKNRLEALVCRLGYRALWSNGWGWLAGAGIYHTRFTEEASGTLTLAIDKDPFESIAVTSRQHSYHPVAFVGIYKSLNEDFFMESRLSGWRYESIHYWPKTYTGLPTPTTKTAIKNALSWDVAFGLRF